MATILRILNKDGTVVFRATVRVKRGGALLLNESRSFQVIGKGVRAEDQARKLATLWAGELSEKMSDKTALAARQFKGLTVAELITKYITYIEKDKLLGESKRCSMGIVSRSRLGLIPVAMLAAADVLAFARDRRAAGVKPQTVNSDIIYLGVVLSRSEMICGLKIDPSQFEIAKNQLWEQGLVAKSAERERRLQDSELGAFLAAAKATAHKGFIPISDIVRFAIETGMRQGEIVGLKWEDLNEEKRTILIRDRKDPKSKVGNNQTVPLLGESMNIINAQSRDDERIFPYHADSVRARFERLCVLAEIKDLTFHDLRHEAISRLFEQGYQIQEVALVSGHRSWKNLKRYTQLKAADLHKDNKMLVSSAMLDRTDRR